MTKPQTIAPGSPEEIIGAFTAPISLTRNDIDNLLSCAFESSSMNGYVDYCYPEGYDPKQYAAENTQDEMAKYGYAAIARGGKLMIREVEWPDGFKSKLVELHELTLGKLLGGIAKYVELKNMKAENVGIFFESEMDSNDASNIIELAIFNEIRYC